MCWQIKALFFKVQVEITFSEFVICKEEHRSRSTKHVCFKKAIEALAPWIFNLVIWSHRCPGGSWRLCRRSPTTSISRSRGRAAHRCGARFQLCRPFFCGALGKDGATCQICRCRRRRRQTNSRIPTQAPPNAHRDEILLQGKPSLLMC